MQVGTAKGNNSFFDHGTESKCVGGHIGLSPTGFVALGSAASTCSIATLHATREVTSRSASWACSGQGKYETCCSYLRVGGSFDALLSSSHDNSHEIPGSILDSDHLFGSKERSIAE